jgi:glycosyltransferase involved in cell wall biosynthesis
MRLTLINQFYPPDIAPTGQLAASLAEHRAHAGDEVTVVTSRGGYVATPVTPGEAGRAANPRVLRSWTPRLGKATVLKRCADYLSFYLVAAWRLLRLPAQDVIVTLTTPPYIAWAAVLHKMLHRRTKLVMWNMDCYPELAERSGALREGGLAARVMRVLNRALFRRVDALVCLDDAMRHLLASQYFTPGREPRTTIIPNWERLDAFPATPAPAEPWDAAGLAGRFVILYRGNAGWGHGFETVLDAAEAMRDEPVAFCFVGGGSRRAFLQQEKDRRRLDNVVLVDYLPADMTPRVMAAAGCGLITLRDPILGVMSPSKLHSYLASGLPVLYVGPQGSNVDEAVRRFECGASLRHGDVAGVTSFVRHLMADAGHREGLSRRARAAFEEAYCDRRTLPQFDELFASLAPPQIAPAAKLAATGSDPLEHPAPATNAA